jgi:hypothetical protein
MCFHNKRLQYTVRVAVPWVSGDDVRIIPRLEAKINKVKADGVMEQLKGIAI